MKKHDTFNACKSHYQFVLIHLESLKRQNDSINTLETTLNEKKGKYSVNYSVIYAFE